jgi:hypothetical protein
MLDPIAELNNSAKSDRWASPVLFVPGTLGRTLGHPSIASEAAIAQRISAEKSRAKAHPLDRDLSSAGLKSSSPLLKQGAPTKRMAARPTFSYWGKAKLNRSLPEAIATY